MHCQVNYLAPWRCMYPHLILYTRPCHAIPRHELNFGLKITAASLHVKTGPHLKIIMYLYKSSCVLTIDLVFGFHSHCSIPNESRHSNGLLADRCRHRPRSEAVRWDRLSCHPHRNLAPTQFHFHNTPAHLDNIFDSPSSKFLHSTSCQYTGHL